MYCGPMAEIHRPPESQQHMIINGERALQSAASEIGSKRQRRPSVRLGDIGGDPPSYDSHFRGSSRSTSKQQWKAPNFPLKESSGNGNNNNNNPHKSSSKTRNLFHLNPAAETLGLDGSENLDSFAVGGWKTKDSSRKRPLAKKARTNWVAKVTSDEIEGGGEPDSDKYSAGGDEYHLLDYDDDDVDDDGFGMDNSESPFKEERSHENSPENLAVDNNNETERDSSLYRRRPSSRAVRRGSGEHPQYHDGVDISGPSDTDIRDRNGQFGEDGVKIWLNGLGLGRYAPVFQIHEVDDEVLPLLTLEDLKDMGINAVGSRRKMYCAIQKLGKGFS